MIEFDPHQIMDEILDQYIQDENPRPWIVGFSGGKDSTMLLQLVWYALKKLPRELRTRPVHVVCNNTLVENPKIIEYNDKVLAQIEKGAAEQSMPVFVHQTTPKLEDTFWVNLIGKGYPAPNNSFRWCTERLKISPTTQFILSQINKEGEAIILLGTRSDESSTRAKSMKKHEIKGERLRKHVLPNAFVYAPIKDVKTDDVWIYLNQVPSPWGSNNKELITLYKNANGGDCPLVIDKTTPSCGNSRFGCWVCTVVTRDKSMEALVDNGEEWLEVLMEFRDYLVETRDLPENREDYRRNGQHSPNGGPYSEKYRSEILEKLLWAQKEIQEYDPEMSLISYQELVAIQVAWHRDSYFRYSVAELYNRVFDTNITLRRESDNVEREQALLAEACGGNQRHVALINELMAIQKSKVLLMNNRGLQTDIENHLAKFLAKHHEN